MAKKSKDAKTAIQAIELLDPRDLKNDEFLSNLQGNILKGHGRDNTVHMLVWFDAGKKEEVAEWIADFAEKKLTSFKEQLRQRDVYKRNGISGGLFAGLYLTARFYTDFGFETKNFSNAEPFVNGMKSRSVPPGNLLQDDYSQIEDAYRQGEMYKKDADAQEQPRKFIHAMILLAHADLISLNMAAHEICEALSDYDPHDKYKEENPIAEILTTEYGSAIRNANGDGLEHFGYVDGISQPLFLQEDFDDYKKGNVASPFYDPSAHWSLVLVRDPMTKEEQAYGSYFVFRKLEQNVRGFKEAEKKLAVDLKLQGEDKERAGAMVIGRFEDGTPVTLSDEDKMISSGIMNNFDYLGTAVGNGEDKGARCPYHGHIRKTNPRTADDLQHRMARRGITYGHRNVSTTVESSFVQMPESGVGLLFMSFQSDIANQFEFIQRAANSDKLAGDPAITTGVDLLIGPATGNRNCQYAKTYNNDSSFKNKPFGNFITFRGGEYFFAPSLAFLNGLKPEEKKV